MDKITIKGLNAKYNINFDEIKNYQYEASCGASFIKITTKTGHVLDIDTTIDQIRIFLENYTCYKNEQAALAKIRSEFDKIAEIIFVPDGYVHVIYKNTDIVKHEISLESLKNIKRELNEYKEQSDLSFIRNNFDKLKLGAIGVWASDDYPSELTIYINGQAYHFKFSDKVLDKLLEEFEAYKAEQKAKQEKEEYISDRESEKTLALIDANNKIIKLNIENENLKSKLKKNKKAYKKLADVTETLLKFTKKRVDKIRDDYQAECELMHSHGIRDDIENLVLVYKGELVKIPFKHIEGYMIWKNNNFNSIELYYRGIVTSNSALGRATTLTKKFYFDSIEPVKIISNMLAEHAG